MIDEDFFSVSDKFGYLFVILFVCNKLDTLLKWLTFMIGLVSCCWFDGF
mgnify:CR=1 FL=1